MSRKPVVKCDSKMRALIIALAVATLKIRGWYDVLDQIVRPEFERLGDREKLSIIQEIVLPKIVRRDNEYNGIVIDLVSHLPGPSIISSLWEELLKEKEHGSNGFWFGGNAWEDLLKLVEGELKREKEKETSTDLSNWYLAEEKRLAMVKKSSK